MSDQNLPDLNDSNQMINAQPETASDRIAPNDATFDNIVVTKTVRIGVPNAETSEPQNRLYVVAPGGFPNNVPIVAQSVSTFFGARDSAGNDRFAINLDSDNTSYPVNFYDKYDGTWRRSISLKLGKVGIGTNNPRSMLHIGDQLAAGYRSWMERGTLVSWDSDNVFFGLKDEGTNRKDAVIAWGDDPNSDVFRFIFTEIGGPPDGQEIMRLQPNGRVGIGTNDPRSMLHIGDKLGGGYRSWMVRGTQVSWDSDNVFFGLKDEGENRKDAVIAWGDDPNSDVFRFIFTANAGPDNGQEIMRLQPNGNVGDLTVTGDVYARVQKLTSSRELKENIAELSGLEAIEALKNLNPVKFNFKADSDKNLHLGFIAEDVPELVANSDRKTLSPMDIVAVLTQALKEQQNTISVLAEKVKLLEAQIA